MRYLTLCVPTKNINYGLEYNMRTIIVSKLK